MIAQAGNPDWILTCYEEKIDMKAMLIRLGFLLECMRRLQFLPTVHEINYKLKGNSVED